MPNIQNSQALISIFGEWPSFHDAEVTSLVLSRQCGNGASLEATIHLWQTTNEIDFEGYFVKQNHILAVLLFDDIVLDLLKDFNHQNALLELSIRELDAAVSGNDGCQFEVVFQAAYGCHALFKCQSISVVSAEHCTPPI